MGEFSEYMRDAHISRFSTRIENKTIIMLVLLGQSQSLTRRTHHEN